MDQGLAQHVGRAVICDPGSRPHITGTLPDMRGCVAVGGAIWQSAGDRWQRSPGKGQKQVGAPWHKTCAKTYMDAPGGQPVDRGMYYLSFELIRVEIRCREAENGKSRWGQQIYGGLVAQTGHHFFCYTHRKVSSGRSLPGQKAARASGPTWLCQVSRSTCHVSV